MTKNVMIVGASMISYNLARILEKSKIKVTLIERDKKRCEELSKLLTDTVIIHGDASDKAVLEEEGLKDCDAFVSLTNIDEENIMLSLYAKTICKGLVITKVDHVNYDTMLNSMGINPIISPKRIIANEIVAYVRALSNAGGNNISGLYRIMNEKAEVICFDVRKEASFIGKPTSFADGGPRGVLFVLLFIIGVFVLVIINLFSIRNRKYEIGVLSSSFFDFTFKNNML